MHQLQRIFVFNGKPVRTLVINNEPWFVAKDVCEILEISNPTMALQRLDEDERSKFNLGRQGETNIVNEPGLYTLILGSRKPEAKQFKRWITHEVIPTIRKTGGTLRIQGSKPERSAFILLQIFGRGPGRHVYACFFTGYAFFILYFINVLTSHLCTKKEILEEARIFLDNQHPHDHFTVFLLPWHSITAHNKKGRLLPAPNFTKPRMHQ